MKRFLVVLALAAVVLGVMLYFMPQPFTQFAATLPQQCTAFVYCRSTELAATNMGNGYLVKCTVGTLRQSLSQCDSVDGVSVRLTGTKEYFDKLQRILQLNVYDVQQIDNLIVVCGYSPLIRGGVYLNNVKVNVQLAYDGATVTLGSPLILDSY